MALRALLVSVASAATLSTGSMASAQGADLARQIATISEGDLQTALEQSGATLSGAALNPFEAREKTYSATFSNGLKAMLVRTACDRDECAGLFLAGLFPMPEGHATAALDEHVRAFNTSYYSAAAVRNDTGQYVIKSYVILNHGITLANLAYQISVFENAMGDFSSHLANME